MKTGSPGPGGSGFDQPKEGAARANRRLLSSALVMTVLTFLSRILGLVREQVRSYYLGTGMGSDAFGLASTIPNLFRRLFGEGAMTAAFVPVFTGYIKKGDQEDMKSFVSSFLTLFTLFMTGFVVLMILITPWMMNTFFSEGFDDVPGKTALTILLTRMMFPYLAIVCVAAVFQAILNSFQVFAPSAFTPVLLNLSIITAALALHDRFPDPSFALAVGFVFGGVLQAWYQLPFLKRLGIRFRFSLNWRHPGIRELTRVFLPGIFGAGIYQINVFVSQMIASGMDQGTIASLQYSVRLQELVLGVFVVSVTTVVLPTFARQFAENSTDKMKETLRFSLGLLAIIAIPATLGLISLGEPIIRLLFQFGRFDAESTLLTVNALFYHSLGIYFIASSRTLSQVFYGRKDLKTPTIAAFFAMLTNIGLCLALAQPLGNRGIALANSASAAVTTVLLVLHLRKDGLGQTFLSHAVLLLRILLAAGLMYLALAGLHLLLPLSQDLSRLELALTLGAFIIIAAMAYALGLAIFARREFSEAVSMVRMRRKRGKPTPRGE